ncbi:MAG: NADH-quinone oxidoreductase subunit N [Anaerolineaceae bacterium]|nr:NADH-quinone oxidoreductase subunit N [Anaerolineaceae bacterium]
MMGAWAAIDLADVNLAAALPALSLAFGACLLLVVDLLLPAARKHWTAGLALAGLAVSFGLTLWQGRVVEELAFFSLYRADGFGALLNLVILGAAALIILMSVDYLQRTGIAAGEYYVLLLFSVSGMLFLTAANDITVLFVGIVLLSIPLPILAAFRWPQDAKSQESGVKYLILSAFSTAFLVFGLVFLYGGTGETNLAAIYAQVNERMAAEDGSSLFYVALGTALALVGLGFKVTIVPFHMYAPDVYEGAPTPVTAFLSVVVKVGAFAALLRILREAVPHLVLGGGSGAASWQLALWLLAAATLILGNTVAIAQRNIKRMLAYSSIAHAGYILMAVAALGGVGVVLRGGDRVLLSDAAMQAALVYLAAYAFSTLGAFAIVMAVERADGGGLELADYAGLARSQPLHAALMAVFMLSLTGIPLTSGFLGKWLVFQVTIEAGLWPLAIIGVLTSVVSAYFYVRVIVQMYLREAPETGESEATPGATALLDGAAYVGLAGTLIVGILPTTLTGLLPPLATLAGL